jgi:hypothetical protein
MEAGPAASRVELAVRIKQWMPATGTEIMTTFPVMVILATERRFCSSLAGNAVLFWRQLITPFIVGFVQGHAGFTPSRKISMVQIMNPNNSSSASCIPLF